MAIGDAVAAFLTGATVDRQPASGVEERITAISKPSLADSMALFDGTTSSALLDAEVDTGEVAGDAAAPSYNPYNLFIMITNSVFLRKVGTTDSISISGVQTNV